MNFADVCVSKISFVVVLMIMYKNNNLTIVNAISLSLVHTSYFMLLYKNDVSFSGYHFANISVFVW